MIFYTYLYVKYHIKRWINGVWERQGGEGGESRLGKKEGQREPSGQSDPLKQGRRGSQRQELSLFKRKWVKQHILEISLGNRSKHIWKTLIGIWLRSCMILSSGEWLQLLGYVGVPEGSLLMKVTFVVAQPWKIHKTCLDAMPIALKCVLSCILWGMNLILIERQIFHSSTKFCPKNEERLLSSFECSSEFSHNLLVIIAVSI